ncbi:DsbE family thiol:disulfide interchange protein [Ferrovibrio sp.]|uniref:DsbE family thiol:disulfide interchange protein n=1 Tax=Ferrovibrio sp. TaxID=1917215 RepID=UPI000CC1FBEB|nr:DsbE family thiol:disulfide interchange protein [Ferrovibrio sp.]PJI38905.1 MAG: DsbE family thiol:disulfide interchange protein [Ferrovibrio sp.]
MRLTYLVPLALFVVIGIGLAIGLTLNPREIPSALIGKPVPEFSLPPVQGRDHGLSTADLKTGQPSVVNVFASWCVPCRVEHPLIMALKRDNLAPIHGLNYKDDPADVVKWLNQLGDPFTRTGADRNGRVGIDWGVYGVPETFVVDGNGQIVCKHVGPLMQHDLDTKIRPLLQDLAAGRASKVKC